MRLIHPDPGWVKLRLIKPTIFEHLSLAALFNYLKAPRACNVKIVAFVNPVTPVIFIPS
ncbi:hypothetical protein NIES23_12100 [Trichormus variabilis NIES-23]|uniref:Uncharacterized protein n=1 Tax=Trichormus variabilis NIES-23 TaxID=1973479 RepID=A0A1Z4KHJ5_ANAVA|nr:hypothetical protein NIES23_12100 [Trichormus variabilis NIES-23]